jgi:hypothetical protein
MAELVYCNFKYVKEYSEYTGYGEKRFLFSDKNPNKD